MLRHLKYLALGSSIAISACASIPVINNTPLKPGTEWVAHSSGWAQEAQDVFQQAAVYVETQSRQRAPKSWAVVLDLDETVLNNVAYQVSRERRGASYTPESWHAWTQKEKATLVPGAAEFIDRVNQAGGHIVFVTNRRDNEQLATETNLAQLGITRGDDFRILLTRASPDGVSDKTSRFSVVPAMLDAQGYPGTTIIAFVGDNTGDKPATVGNWQFFCVDQGAMYGDPCAGVPGPGL